MPLRCVSGPDNPVFAYDYDRAQWRELAERNRKDRHLLMPCCGRSATVKTSHCGTQFFAHARKEGVSCPHESDAHLLAKDLVARAIGRAGWLAEAEAPLRPHSLIADVLATNGRRRVAFEVQWSRQTHEATQRRHDAYAKAGVRELWLFKQWEYPLSKEVPAFRLTPNDDHSFDVCVWRDGNGYQKPTEIFQTVGLPEFIAGALSGRLRWAPSTGLTVTAVGHVGTVSCRRGHHAAVLLHFELDIARLLPGHLNPSIPLDRFAEFPEFMRTAHARAEIDRAGLSLGFGIWDRGHTGFKDSHARYVKSLCKECGSAIDTQTVREFHSKPAPMVELPLRLTTELLAAMPNLRRQLECWWFDSR